MPKQDSTSCEKIVNTKNRSLKMNSFMELVIYVIKIIKSTSDFCRRY